MSLLSCSRCLKDVRELKEFKVSHLCKAHHVSPALKDVEQVLKLITETGASCLFIILIFNVVMRLIPLSGRLSRLESQLHVRK